MGYTRLSLAELKALLTQRLGDNSVFWGAREKQYAINEALRVWAVMTGVFNRKFQRPTTGDVLYEVPKQIVSLRRVVYSGQALNPLTLLELDVAWPNWQGGATGTPHSWAPVGLAKVVVYPKPALGGNIVFEGVALTPALGSDGDFVEVGDEDVVRLLDYAHHYAALKEGGLEQKATMGLMGGVVDAAVQKNQRLRAAGVFGKYLGIPKDSERPDRAPGETMGARG